MNVFRNLSIAGMPTFLLLTVWVLCWTASLIFDPTGTAHAQSFFATQFNKSHNQEDEMDTHKNGHVQAPVEILRHFEIYNGYCSMRN